jgi:ABC-2 type transport system ATP-binding protein
VKPAKPAKPVKPTTRRTDKPEAATPRPKKPAVSTSRAKKKPAPSPKAQRAPRTKPEPPPVVVEVTSLRKTYGSTVAVDDIDLTVRRGSMFGVVGPNGAGKTTTLSMITGLLRPDSGTVLVAGLDVWRDPIAAKRVTGVLPDRMRLFDRLTGAQLLYYCGMLHGLDRSTASSRTEDLGVALGIEGSLNRPVRDYSIGMVKKISLAAAMIHSPRVLVLDEPFESVDPVSTSQAIDLLQRYTASGGTVLLSSHNMALVERVCDSVAVIVDGSVLAVGTLDEVRGGRSLEERFVELAGGRVAVEGLEWLTTFSD